LSQTEIALLRLSSEVRFARLARRLQQCIFDVRHVAERSLGLGERRLNAAATRLQQSLPTRRLARYDEHLLQAAQRLVSTLRQRLLHGRQLLWTRMESVSACNPKRVLDRGYSITRDARTRRVIRSIEQIRDKLRIVTEVSDGEFQATAEDPKQPGLFD
jgi:exodeoxyribonuclease VII large subunit